MKLHWLCSFAKHSAFWLVREGGREGGGLYLTPDQVTSQLLALIWSHSPGKYLRSCVCVCVSIFHNPVCFVHSDCITGHFFDLSSLLPARSLVECLPSLSPLPQPHPQPSRLVGLSTRLTRDRRTSTMPRRGSPRGHAPKLTQMPPRTSTWR